MIFQTFVGEESFEGTGSINVSMAYRMTAAGPHDLPLDRAATDARSGVTLVGQPQTIMASARNRHHGYWKLLRLTVPELSFVKIIIRRMINAQPWQTGALVLYQRPHAALTRIRVPFTGHQDAQQACGYIEGRFDMLDEDQINDLKYAMTTYNRGQLITDYADWFTYSILEEESRRLIKPSTQTITTRSGEEAIVVKRNSLRKLNLKGKR